MSRDPIAPRVLIAAMLKWYLHHTAKAFEQRDALAGYWVSNANITGVGNYRRIWPYHLLKKPFYHLPFVQLEEWTRWLFLPAYDAWLSRQAIPSACNVVMGPMGSCIPLFDLADRQERGILKVFDAPNSHPRLHAELWRRECGEFMPGYEVPFPDWVVERISREIEQADLILCPSDFVKESMVAQGVPPAKCHVRHFGVDTSIFKPREAVPESPVFVSVGSVCLRKGHQYLFRAFAKLRETFPHARLICIGGIRPDFDQEWPLWRDLIEHHPFLPQPRIAEILQGATAFVLPSVEEGFARVLSEAMAAGLPLIATHESGATTVVRNQVEGIIIPSRDIRALQDAMLLLAKDQALNRSMGEAALKAGALRNTWQDYGDNLLEGISQAMAAKS
ncbi:glycosyltransferase family 4 protein [Luteolibacter luteus]|uniref:Glycosyltransferase family 4 protein n=1 Tax=Luteolibacter luteus TaxID=2728835 RepID=A0A858RJF7_9BACT|nr:glycosyltransferase family 4 protein [Luteolibacter luteus]QJE96982.1 glycosyltransferase family 4 protein [Luteolibacter luteus]